MSQDKHNILQKGKEFNKENSENIRFDPNVPVTVVFPSDWHLHFKQEVKESRDNKDETYVQSTFQVMNPNSTDPKKLRTLKASEALYDAIAKVLEESIEQGYEGSIIMKITKEMKGGNQYGTWSVQGKKINLDGTVEE